jgi:MoaA/NifB/PqqE/SkfB family radical SAM enzyme
MNRVVYRCPMMNLTVLQRVVPARVKYALKPYYRTIFPNRVHLYWLPTSRCNYRCSYCPVVTNFDFSTIFTKRGERSGSDWLEAFDRMPPFSLYIYGGEPFVYADLATVINDLPAKHSMLGIVTNLSQPVAVYRKIKRSVHLNASFHREFANEEDFIAKIRELKDQFTIQVNIVATPENLPVLKRVSEEFSRSEISMHVDPYLDLGFEYTAEQLALLRPFLTPDREPKMQADYADFSPKRCSAGRNYLHVAADGSAYTCGSGLSVVHSTLFAEWARGRDVSKYRIGNLFDADFRLNQGDIECSIPCIQACDRDMAIIRPAASMSPRKAV